ncbi:MAG: GyrI-like domain-containing protein [Bacteroidetes bacterium]|nr:GyrI-like domain-containing protein [Bacteroidota bacterium]
MLMNILPEIKLLELKTLIGMHQSMSLVANATQQLWSKFKPRVGEVQSRRNEDFISLQIYPPDYFIEFNPLRAFEKWALVETEAATIAPEGMDIINLPGGLYAVFNYKGNSNDTRIFQYIYTQWLPASNYVLDSRPHFEVLGPAYIHNDTNAEEEIYIPIKNK